MPQLKNRVGLLKKLARALSSKALKGIAAGIFQSKLLFGMPVMGTCWYSSKYRESPWNKVAMNLG